MNANNVINIFLAKKDQETYLEIILNKLIQIYFDIKPLMPIILYSLVIIVWLYLIYKLGRINLNKLRAGLLVELLNVWDNDVVYDTVINEDDLDSDKIYLKYKLKETKLFKFLYEIYGENYLLTVKSLEDGLKKDNKILKCIRFTGKAILTSVLPLYLATVSIANIYGFIEPNEIHIRMLALFFTFIMGLGFLIILNSQFTGNRKEIWKWKPCNSNFIKLVYYEKNIFKLLIYIVISVIMIFLFKNVYREQIESPFFIKLMSVYYIFSIFITFVKFGEDKT